MIPCFIIDSTPFYEISLVSSYKLRYDIQFNSSAALQRFFLYTTNNTESISLVFTLYVKTGREVANDSWEMRFVDLLQETVSAD